MSRLDTTTPVPSAPALDDRREAIREAHLAP